MQQADWYNNAIFKLIHEFASANEAQMNMRSCAEILIIII